MRSVSGGLLAAHLSRAFFERRVCAYVHVSACCRVQMAGCGCRLSTERVVTSARRSSGGQRAGSGHSNDTAC